jgi:hypothetical protein
MVHVDTMNARSSRHLRLVREGQLRPIFSARCATMYSFLAQRCMLQDPAAR